MLKGQCTQDLKDQMIHDSEWADIEKDGKPLLLMKMLKKLSTQHGQEQYQVKTAYDHPLNVQRLLQNRIPSVQFYERFNTKIDVARSVGANGVHMSAVPLLLTDITKALMESQ